MNCCHARRSGVALRGARARPTSPASCSRSPTTSMYGILRSSASRILRADRLGAVVELGAQPGAAELLETTLAAYSLWRSAIGSTIACTGASHSGKLAARSARSGSR